MGRENEECWKRFCDETGDADEIAAIMYEISGHYGKIAHLYTKLAAMREKGDATSTTNDSATPEG